MKTGVTRRITFILPCAGSGRRLGYEGHKELFPILPDVRLIDFSLEHIREAGRWVSEHSGWELRVAVVIQPRKSDVSDYVIRSLPGMQVVPVLFDQTLHEWPGSVHSASKLYGDINIVLLPDSRLLLSPGKLTRDVQGCSIVEIFIQHMIRFPVVFGYMPCTDVNTIKSFGAIHVICSDDGAGTVDRFQDKPRIEPIGYNGYWCCYGFRAEVGEALYHFLKRSVMHEPADILAEVFHPAFAFPVHEYADLGTPEAVDLFRSE